MLKYKIFTWDYKEHADWDEINKYLDSLASTPYFHNVYTDSDSWAVLIANRYLYHEEAQDLYNKTFKH